MYLDVTRSISSSISFEIEAYHRLFYPEQFENRLQVADSPQRKPGFLSDARCFGLHDKFQDYIEISFKTARISLRSFRFLCLC